MFFMNNFAVADLIMLLFRSVSVDLRINQLELIEWKYGEYLCYFVDTAENTVSGKYRGVTHQSDTFGLKSTHIRMKHLVTDLHTLD